MTAKPGSQNLYIYRGDPWTISFSSVLDGVAETVVAANALAQIRSTVDDVAIVATFTVAVAGNVVTLSLTATQTAAIPATQEGSAYVWDFQPAISAETWLKGTVTVEGDVSK